MEKSAEKNLFRIYFHLVIFSCLAVSLLIANTACGNSSSGGKTAEGSDPANSATKMTDLERDIKSMKTAGFETIFLFRRKDGGIFDSEDKTYLRLNSPADVNRWTMSDEGKVFIAGSNFSFPEANLEILENRFDIENLSPEKKEEKNGNQATNENGGNQTDNNETKKNQANK